MAKSNFLLLSQLLHIIMDTYHTTIAGSRNEIGNDGDWRRYHDYHS